MNYAAQPGNPGWPQPDWTSWNAAKTEHSALSPDSSKPPLLRPSEWRQESRALPRKPNNKPRWDTTRPIVSQRIILAEHCLKNRPSCRSTAKDLMNRFPDAVSSRNVLQTLPECPWAHKGQWKVLPEGQLAPTDLPPAAETCFQTIRRLAGQLPVYTDGSATAGTVDGSKGVIVTCGDPAYPTILHWSHFRGVAFTSSLAEEAAAMQLALEWATANHLEHSLTGHRQSTVARQLPII